MNRTVYLDNSATTSPCKEAVDAINTCLLHNWGNPSSTYSLGIEAMEAMEASRKCIADFIGAKKAEIVFTGSGTEANNLALFGIARANKRKGNKIVSTTIEHPSVLEALKGLEKEGFEIILLSPDENGIISENSFRNAIDKNTILVSVMLANNEIGSVQDIQNISQIIKDNNSPALLHCDAVQAFGKLPIKIKRLGVDLLSASGHKIHASKGVGFLYKSENINIYPILYGGGQENGLRSGTECLPLIMGLCAAVKALPDIENQYNQQKQLWQYAKDKLLLCKNISINSPENALPYILNISINNYKSEPMLNALAMKNIFVSKGSACAKGHRSYVLSEIGLKNDRIDSAIRISFSRYNTKEDVDILCDAIKEIIGKMRRFR